MDRAPLAGIVVVAVEQAVAAPFATRQLADLGATVIKVERPGGDFARRYDTKVAGLSAFFVWANRGKHSIVLDLKDEADRARLDALVAGADVVVHNLAPAAAARLRVDAASLRVRRRELVVCEVSGYGATGPRGGDPAYDLAVQAEAGAFAVTGTQAQMSKVGLSVADIAGAMYALSGILAALVRRDRTGEGATVQVSLLDSLVEWMSAPLYAAVHGGGRPPRTGRRHHAIAPYGTFRLAGGHEVLIAVQHDGEWQRLARGVVARPELADEPAWTTAAGRIADVDRLEAALGKALLALPAAVVLDRLRAQGIAVARVNDLSDVWTHEQLRARGRFVQVAAEHGPVELLRPPFDLDGWTPPPGRVTGLGEHDPAVLAAVVERGRSAGR